MWCLEVKEGDLGVDVFQNGESGGEEDEEGKRLFAKPLVYKNLVVI